VGTGPPPFPPPAPLEPRPSPPSAPDTDPGVQTDPSTPAATVEAPSAPDERPSTPRPRPPRSARARPRVATSMGGTGTVNVATPGGWAEIFEDGRRVGRAPGRLELPAGRHTLELRPFGTGAPVRVTVTVAAGETARVSQPLTP